MLGVGAGGGMEYVVVGDGVELWITIGAYAKGLCKAAADTETRRYHL